MPVIVLTKRQLESLTQALVYVEKAGQKKTGMADATWEGFREAQGKIEDQYEYHLTKRD